MTLQLYVLRQLLFSVGVAVAGILAIVLPTIAIQAIHKVEAVSLSIVLGYLPMVVVELVPYLLPMAFLLGVVATYGRLAAERELLAIRMAGVHPARLALPALGVACLFSWGTNVLLAEISPEWKFRQRSYLRQAQAELQRSFAKGQTYRKFGNSSIMADDVSGNVFKGVLLDMDRGGGERLKIDAEQATLDVLDDELVIKLEGAWVLTEDAQIGSESPLFRIPIDDLFPERRFERTRAKYHKSSSLERELSNPELGPERRHELRYEIHRRHAFSITYILFLLLGIPTGIVLRSSTQLGAFTGAVGYCFLYYVLALRLGKELAETGAVSALAAAWSTDVLFFAAGIILFVRTLWR